MKVEVEGKPCTILLDSCSSACIVSESFMMNYLNKNRSQVHGPIGLVKGIGKTITYDKGRIDLKLRILDGDYIEEFVIMREPGIPGSILLSAEAMGRCGLDVNFRKRKIRSEDSNKEVTFSLGATGFSVNRARLQKTSTSKQTKLDQRDLLNSRNIDQYHPRKIKYFYRRHKYYHRRNRNSQRSKVKALNKNELVPDSTLSPQLEANKTTENTSSTESAKDHKQKHDNENRILKLMQKVNKIEDSNYKQNEARSLVTVATNINNQTQISNTTGEVNPDSLAGTNECSSMIDVEHKTLTEVLHLGTIPIQQITENIVNNGEDSDLSLEYAYFADNSNIETQVHCISTNDDYTVTFKVSRDVYLAPNYCSKVQLTVQDENIDIRNKEIILKTFKHTPEALKMDNSLVKLQGLTCETYICNNTDKNIRLITGQTFCEGIVLDHPTMGVTEGTFCSISSVVEDKVEKEIGQIQYPEGKTKLMKLLTDYRNVIALEGDKLGRTTVAQHKILLEDNAKPFFIPNYKLPMSRREIIEEMISDMKADGIVKPSESPYNSPLLLVPKKDGSWRMVIDYRQLNKQTIPDRFPMPVINDVLSQLGGAKIFTSLDLLSGYWQVPLDEESKPLTAFSTHLEHLEFQVLPFGLTNAPLTFSRVMLQVLGGIKNVFVYLDDIIIFNEDVDGHFRTLREVLERFQKAGLKLKVRKCQFLMKELEYLGHKINKEGIKMQEGKIKAIVDYPAPTNVKSLRRFLGMIGYYRPFIQNFSTIAHALTDLLKQDREFIWDKEQQKAFETLKQHLTKDPILVYPDFNQEFYLATDASSTGLGAVLMQKRKCRMRVISYASRVLNDTEKRYSTTERECLALFWGLKKYKHLILGYKVNILTDHKPLLDLYKKREFINNSKFNRWFLAILEFNPDIKYIPGRSNTLADGLSRAFEETESKVEDKKFCFKCQVVELDLTIVKEQQDKDTEIRNIMGDILLDETQRPDFQLINGMVYKKPRSEDEWPRLYIPKTLINEVLQLTHSHMLAGHPGIQKTKNIVSKNYFWPGCSKDVENFINACITCNQHKGVPNVPAPLEKYPTQLYPFQVVTMDFLGPMPSTYRGNKYLLVFIDYLTRWVEIVPCADRLASTVAEALKSTIIVRHSCPEVLLSDNAPEFTSEVLNKLCSFYDIKKVEITAYKPSSNGAVERANQKIKQILRTLITPETVDWDKAVEDVQLVINNTVNVTTGESPHFLLYGYAKRLPINLCDDARPPQRTYNYDEYIVNRIAQYYNTVRKTRELMQKSQKNWEIHYKCKEKNNIKVGSQVYLQKMVPEGPNVKVSPKFEGPYRVLEVLKGNKYKIIHETNSNSCIAHYNHLKLSKNHNLWLQNKEDLVPPSDVGGSSGRYALRPRH